MQAYEHIMATMLKLSKKTEDLKGLTLEENLTLMRKYGAYFTYPDSVRAIVKLSTGGAFRQPSHMSEGAWMQCIIGEELKSSNNGYPLDKIFIPEGLELKSADAPTNIDLFIEHNQELLETREGRAIYEHLKQDTYTDKLFQGYLATCYIDEKDVDIRAGKTYSLYGVKTKAGLARFKQTGNIVPMSEFREVVADMQKLTTLKLFRELRKVYPDITFEKIEEAIYASYDNNYPKSMMNAKQYVIPSQKEQSIILSALDTQDYSYYEEIKEKLVKKGAFKNIEDIDREVNKLFSEVISLNNEQNSTRADR